MKLRIMLSAITVFLSLTLDKTINFFYSPITGLATANSLNDSVGNYGWAKFVRDGEINDLIWWSCAVILSIIWIQFMIKYNKQNN